MADNSKDIQLRELKKLIKTLQETVDAANERERTLTQERDNLKEELRLLRQKLFNTSSEKRPLSPKKQNFFNEQDPETEAEKMVASFPEKRTKKRKARAADAVPQGKKLDYNQPAVQGILYIDKFFRLEEDIKAKHTTFDIIRKARLKKEKPVVEGFLSWLEKLAVL
mgnify:CR=1 FL=1